VVGRVKKFPRITRRFNSPLCSLGELANIAYGNFAHKIYSHPNDARLSAMAANKDLSPETLLRRSEFATALTEAGFPIASATLATIAVRGGGPPFRYFGRIPLYPWGEGLDWARGRLSKPVASTAEAALLAGHA